VSEPPGYRELFELGRGGMGTVHLAWAVGAGGFERLVVIKRMHAHLLSLEEASRRFLHEAQAASKLHHANVVGIHQVGRDARGYFLVFDFVEGGTLESLVDRSVLKGGTLAAPVVMRVILDALAGLQAAHEAKDVEGRGLGILHRDVSLQNVLVGTDGVARVADFGVAKSAISSVSTEEAHFLGKLMYVPPEHLRRAPCGPSFDVYSLGVTMWIALTGLEPWSGADESQLIRHILDDGLPPPSSSGVAVAPQLEEIVMRACASDVRERYGSAREMRDVIERMARDTGWLASHGEVAEVVQRLMGTDLARVRARVHEVSASGYDYVARERGTGANGEGSANGGTVSRGRRSRLLTAALVGTSVVAVGVAAWWATRLRIPGSGTTAPGSPDVAEVAVTGPTVVAAPASGAVDGLPGEPRAVPAASSVVAPPLPARPPPKKHPHAPTSNVEVVPKAPPEIEKKNPYRE
jgi:serine/threonine-protein kinase